MNREQSIEIMKQKLENSNNILSFEIEGLRFCLLTIMKTSVRCSSGEEITTYVTNVTTRSYSDKVWRSKFSIFYHRYSTFEECFDSAYNIFGPIRYSKITDRLYDCADKMKREENYKEAEFFLLHKKLDECCVCFDSNIVKTICGHNLCRLCACKLSDRFSCPICRTKLGCNCSDCDTYDGEDDIEHHTHVEHVENENDDTDDDVIVDDGEEAVMNMID
jgi:hypothetical protein